MANEAGILHVDKEQDCKRFSIERKENETHFSFTREFVTCDDEDYEIEDGTTHVLYATGPGPLIKIEGLDLHDYEWGMARVQLLKPGIPIPRFPEGTFPVDVSAEKVAVPSEETTYWCHVYRLPDRHAGFLPEQFEPRIEKKSRGLVHHMEVFHCETRDPSAAIPLYRGHCHADDRPREVDVCKRVLAAWAMGASPFWYPQEAGLPIGGADFNRYVMLEVHYNNPDKISGKPKKLVYKKKDEIADDCLRLSGHVDSSGIRLHASSRLRKYDAGVLELGLEYTPKMALPPRMDTFYLSGFCISECTALGLPEEGIMIFGSQLHSHLTGRRIWTRHVREGRELPELNRDNHYSTHFQEIRILKEPVHVLPGDALVTTCHDSTLDRENVTVGGFAISDEMCVNYVHYYPKMNLEVCKSSVDSEALDNYFRFMELWENQATSPEKDVTGNYHAISWTPLRADGLKSLYETAPLSMQCNQSNGDRFPGAWEAMPQTQILHPLPPAEEECPEE
ncbi:unnamed protein product [Darwinula stevensoni]|uniref:DOMON domain-containing protein n=1 Tax=Darwinula stevensoni TaxID=69355 RepID=A0A7R9A2F4_9CRUS|nr:unnamed protein product [Darwinula stevensoni]CAG0879812.1 unnamed protein product [Darwinula stevensoni]